MIKKCAFGCQFIDEYYFRRIYLSPIDCSMIQIESAAWLLMSIYEHFWEVSVKILAVIKGLKSTNICVKIEPIK